MRAPPLPEDVHGPRSSLYPCCLHHGTWLRSQPSITPETCGPWASSPIQPCVPAHQSRLRLGPHPPQGGLERSLSTHLELEGVCQLH